MVTRQAREPELNELLAQSVRHSKKHPATRCTVKNGFIILFPVEKCYRQLTTLYSKSNIINDNIIAYSNFEEDAGTPCKTIGCKTVQY